jgi:hypothetical protein
VRFVLPIDLNRKTILSFGLLAFLPAAYLGSKLLAGRQGIRSEDFRIQHTFKGKGQIALSGNVLLPKGIELGNEQAAFLRLVDDQGREFSMDARQIRPGEARFRVSAGYPEAGRASLQLVINDRIAARTDLGVLPVCNNVFDVQSNSNIQVQAKGQRLSIRLRAEAGEMDTLTLRPLRTELQEFSPSVNIEMTRLGNGFFEASITVPYASEAHKFEFEIQHQKYEPDEFVFKGASLGVDGARPVLTVDAPVRVTSKFGRKILIPKQRQMGKPYRRSLLLAIEVEGVYRTIREVPKAVDPPLESLGLDRIDFQTVWNKHMVLSGGNLGIGIPEDRLGYPKTPVKQGQIGPLRVRLYQSDRPSKTVGRFAVPIEQAAPRQPSMR